MAKVLVPMQPFGAAVDRFDMSPLAQYGAIHFLFDKRVAPSLKPTESLRYMAERFEGLGFDPERDFLCPFSPDSFGSFATGLIMGAVDYGPKLRLLRYDRPMQADGTRAPRGVYVPVSLELWPLERV